MLTQEKLYSILNYDQDTGIFTWKVNRRNKAKINTVAGYKESEGYIVISVFGKSYKAHRLAWLYVYGELPNEYIDHINGNKSDNKIENLRICTNAENQWNSKISSKNVSGVKGVHWCNTKKRWKAKLSINGKIKHIGYFTDLESAKIKLMEAREKLHKDYANHG